jgi:hypothetical protein
MDEIVDRVLHAYRPARELDADGISQTRAKIGQYIDKLASAGQKDPKRLTAYARAYLKELHEGRDPRFTGC